MRKYIEERVITKLVDADNRRVIVLGVGLATFFFGFAAGAILNIYLIWIQSPLVTQLRSTLNYKSAIFGDGIVLPVVNMIITIFLIKHETFINKKILQSALIGGLLITAYFNITQAMEGIVNWAMPKPWQWNILGVWHGIYMLFATSLVSLFYIVLFRVIKKNKSIPKEAAIVTIGIVIFAILLRLDYMAIDLKSLIPNF